MILICPNCHTKSKLKASNLPKQGAWAKCPKCSEKFFVRPEGQATTLNANDENKSMPQKPAFRKRTEDAQALINKFKKQRGEETTKENLSKRREYFDEHLDIITVFPRATIPPITLAFFAFILSLSLFLIIAGSFLSVKSYNQKKSAQTIMHNAEKGKQIFYGEKEIVKDIETLRRKIQQNSANNYLVNTFDIEVKLSKYYLKELDPKGCQEISSINVNSFANNSEFIFDIDCYDKNFHNPSIKFNLKENNSKFMEVILSIPTTGVTKGQTEINLWSNVSQKQKNDFEQRNIEFQKQLEEKKQPEEKEILE